MWDSLKREFGAGSGAGSKKRASVEDATEDENIASMSYLYMLSCLLSLACSL
jgi:hypothetical protein